MTASVLRSRLECARGDTLTDRSTFYYRFVGGLVGSSDSVTGPWRRSQRVAFTSFLYEVSQKTPLADVGKVCLNDAAVPSRTVEEPHRLYRCSLCQGAGREVSSETATCIDFGGTCPQCGGGGTHLDEALVLAELTAVDAASVSLPASHSDTIPPSTQPAPPEKVD